MATKVTTGLISADAALVDLNIDANTLYVDASANRVGMGTTAPSTALHVKGDEVTVEDPSGGYKLHLNADANPVTITANDNTGANYCGFRLKTNNGGGSPVTAMHVYPHSSTHVGFGTDARTDTKMVISKVPSSATQTTPETILTLSNPTYTTASDIKVGQGPRLVFEIPDDQSGNKATGAAIAALKEIDSDTNSQTSLAFYTSDDDETLDQNMTILSDGKVGIGETSPDLKLHVKSSGQIAKLETTATTGDCILTFADAAANKGYVGFGSSSSEIFQITNIENGDMRFDTNNTERMKITSNVVNVRNPVQTAQRNGSYEAACKYYTHLATADLYGAGNGYTVIDTNIPSWGYSGDQQMFSIFIKGYGYDQSDTGIIDMAVGAYSGENNYHNATATGTGIPNAWKGKINVARNTSTNKVAIILGSATGANNFNIAVTDFTQSYQNEDDDSSIGWNIQRLTSISGYDRVTACRNRYSTDIPAFRAYLTSNTSIGSGTGVFTSGFSEIFDKQNNHNQANGRFTAPQTGLYKFSGHINLNAGTTSFSYLSAEIVKNGTDRYIMSGWNEASGSESKYHAAAGSVLLDLALGDYVTFGYEISSAFTALAGYSHTSWDGHLVS